MYIYVYICVFTENIYQVGVYKDNNNEHSWYSYHRKKKKEKKPSTHHQEEIINSPHQYSKFCIRFSFDNIIARWHVVSVEGSQISLESNNGYCSLQTPRSLREDTGMVSIISPRETI